METMTKPIFPILPESPSAPPPIPSRKERAIAARAKYERFWKTKPVQKPEEAEELVRQERILAMGKTWGLHTCKNFVDLGCGDGRIGQYFASSTTHMTALDIAQNALSRLSSPHMTRVLGSMPDTLLPDGSFPAILCTDLLSELDPRDYRLAISEMARLLAPQGLLFFSCPIDYTTDQPVALLRQLLGTEFVLVAEELSHHRLLQQCKKLLSQLPLWLPGREKLLTYVKHNRSFLLCCERLSRLWWSEAGTSHLIVCARKKPLPFL